MINYLKADIIWTVSPKMAIWRYMFPIPRKVFVNNYAAKQRHSLASKLEQHNSQISLQCGGASSYQVQSSS